MLRLALSVLALLVSYAPALEAQGVRQRERAGLEIRQGWKGRLGVSPTASGTAQRSIVASRPPVSGTLRLPVLRIQASEKSFGTVGADVIEQRIDGASADFTSARAYYAEMSGGRMSVEADLAGAVIQLPKPSSYYVGTRAGNGVATHLDEYLQFVASRASELLDWREYDNDGPDGVPNSGDDDGIVDAVVLVFSTEDGSCAGPDNGKMWSHRWSLSDVLGAPFETTRIGANGASIRLDDYIIAPAFACDGQGPAGPGTLIHEIGHILGLADLYAVGSSAPGAGLWSLMASGNWFSEAHPTALDPWSRSLLGWVEERLASDSVDLRISPVSAGAPVIRVPSESGDYLLLEYRTRTDGIDRALPGEGLLMWQVDPAAVSERYASNTLNADPAHPAVAVVEADGAFDLREGRNYGDGGDVWPGSAERTSFSHESVPASVTLDGQVPLEVRLDRIRIQGDAVVLDVTSGYDLMARVRIESETSGLGLIVDDSLSLTLPIEWDIEVGHEIHVRVDTASAADTRLTFLGWSDGLPFVERTIRPLSRAPITLSALVEREHLVNARTSDPALGQVRVAGQDPADSLSFWADEEAMLDLTANSTAGRFLFWSGVSPDGERSILGTEIDLAVALTGPLVVEAVFASEDDISRDLVAAVLDRSAPSPVLDFLDLSGNANGRFDSGDLVLALEAGRAVRNGERIRLALPPSTMSVR